MSSEHLQLLIAGYVLGDLDPAEVAEFERLLEQNPAIAQEVEQMQETLTLAYDPPEVAPPARLRSAILNTTVRTRRSIPWNRILNVAAAAIIAALGIQNYALRRSLLQSQAETQRLAELNFALQGTARAKEASAKFEVDPNTLEGVLTVQNLPPLPPGKVYALWTVLKPEAPFTVDRQNAILTVAFTVDAQGNATQTIPVPKVYRTGNLVTRVAVTSEDAAAPQRHQGKAVLTSQL
ncbi:anti-sigma factor [Leptolyngbya sp. NIES-2104]|uniref:anti-sigma factor n=1 Tax=Leptolyngbya sp. NIES-2104 TaxID=1552121 RepID=UPI001CED1F82|nr:anti-sigma factor [Leptolyngbya sp. NIES-2104]